MLVHRLITCPQGHLGEGSHQIGGGARRQLDLPAQAFGLVVRHAGLGDDQAVDRARGDGVELHRPSRAEHRSAGIGVEQRDPAVGRSIQVAIDAPDVDEPALASVARQRDSGYPAQGFGRVEVWVLADGLRRLDVDEVRRIQLLSSGGDLLPRRRHHHPAHRVRSIGLLSLRGRPQGDDTRGTRQDVPHTNSFHMHHTSRKLQIPFERPPHCCGHLNVSS